MRANASIVIIICLLFLVGTVAAIKVDTVTITSDQSYVYAGGGAPLSDQSTITVTVWNTSMGKGVQTAKVNFSVNDPALGTLNPVTFTTGIDGKAISVFKAKTKSGFAIINVSVYYSDIDGIYFNFFNITQKIDHNMAQNATFNHPIEGPVGSNVSFKISFTDRYGNPIDQLINPGKQHTINLHVYGPTPDDGGFVGYGHDILNHPLDINGNVSAMVQLSSGAGPNTITMDLFEEIPPPVTRVITGVSSSVFSMEQLFVPDSPAQVPADGVSKFSIIYTLFDKFMNPVSQQEVWVNTSIAGEEQKFKTDTQGQIMITYGPRVTIGVINITATAVNNNTVIKYKSVEFLSTAAYDMVLTANPEYIPSREVSGTSSSTITATVTDISGNPVENENVTFSMGAAGYPGGPYNVTFLPSLSPSSPISVSTDAEGHATVQFIPGGFSINQSALNYDSTATGNCTVTATWISSTTGNTVSKDILLTWKNYPYLSVRTSVNPSTVEVNKTVDVTISLKADGLFLQPNPIDVVLVMDRSGSMDTAMSGGTRLSVAKIAAKSFVSQMNQSRDRIGVVSYAGYTSGTGTRTDISLSSTYTNVNHVIDNHLAADGATETREALKQSIELLHASPNPSPTAIQTIILMTDGNYNWKGNPLGRGTGYDSSYTGYSTNALEPNEYRYYTGLGCTPSGGHCHDGEFTNQNMSIYAKNNNIRLYMIGFASTLDAQAVSDMNVMANATGGFYQYAPDAATLNQIYTKIAGELNDKAGVNTTMAADFNNVVVNNATIPSGADVYDYVYNSTASTKIKWQDGVTNVTNQTTDWTTDNKLDFKIGTMKVGQTWEATFRLKVKQSGIIDLFGTNSALLFNGTDPLTLPHTFLTVVPNLTAIGFGLQTIDVTSNCPQQVQNSVILPITWTTNYTGPNNTIFEEAFYISQSGARVPFWHGSYFVPGNDERSRSAQFDMRTVPPGNYTIQVETRAGVSAATSQPCGSYAYSTKGITFIKLE
jgi:hypothetical protein